MSGFELLSLPDHAKEQLCRSLLAELGVTRVSSNPNKGELTHCCVMPWHSDSHPSAGLSWKKLTYKCFSCGSSGGLLWLVGVCRGLTTPQARSWLAEQTGTGADGFDLSALLELLDAVDAGRPGRQPIPVMSTRVLDPWRLVHPWLTDPPDGSPPGRGVPVQNVVDLQVGYADSYPLGGGRVGPRIVIPHLWRGELVGWQTRRLCDDGSPKYMSTPDFPRDRTIYHHVPECDLAVVVESPMSVLRHAHHLPVEATFGAEVTDCQVQHLAGHRRVVLWPDPDPAGWTALEGHWTDRTKPGRGGWVPGLADRLQPYTDVRVVASDWYADPADIDEATAEGLVDGAVPWAVWRRPEVLRCWLCKRYHVGSCL